MRGDVYEYAQVECCRSRSGRPLSEQPLCLRLVCSRAPPSKSHRRLVAFSAGWLAYAYVLLPVRRPGRSLHCSVALVTARAALGRPAVDGIGKGAWEQWLF